MNTAWAVVSAVMAWIIYFMQFGVNAETRIAFKPNIALKQNMFYMNAVRFECMVVASKKN